MTDALPPARVPQSYMAPAPESSRPPGKKKRSTVFLWLWLAFSLVAILCFWATVVTVDRSPGAVIIMWVPFLIGVGLVLVAGIFAVIAIASFLSSPSWKSAVLPFVCVCTGIVSLWGVVRATIALLWGGAKAVAMVAPLVLPLIAIHPWGAVAVCAWMEMEKAERDKMENSLQPEWQLVQVEYAGLTPPEAPEGLSLKFTNTGPHAITEMRGSLHVWNTMELAKVDLPISLKEPLGPGESVSLNLPLDETGIKVRRIIESADSGNPDSVEDPVEDPVEDGVEPVVDRVAHLRYKLQRLTDQSGEVFEIRWGNLEPQNGTAFYGITRGLDNSEWRRVSVEYLGMQTAANPGRAAFGLSMPDDYQIASLKGKLHVIDIKEGHVEAKVELHPPQALAPGDVVVFALPAGPDSQLADKIITSRTAYDQAIGNDIEASHFVRFQLRTMKTDNGKTYSVNWLGMLKED